MNLLDMLSKDPPSSLYNPEPEVNIQNNAISFNSNGISNGISISESQDTSTINNDSNSNNNNNNNSSSSTPNIIYLPTLLTELQKSLVEMTLHLFSSELLNTVRSKRLRTSIDNLLDSSNTIEESDKNTNENKISLCFEQLSMICNHPSLLIDHFIPKKMLLLETIERQLNLSGKLEILNRIIDTLIEEKPSKGYRIIVVANNVKELELVEGIVLGKTLYYINSANAKLFEDRRFIPDLKDKSSNKIFINLLTTQQLYNNYVSDKDGESYDLIFSFDPNLDAQTPSIEIFQLENNNQCPILVPIPVFTLEHIGLQLPQPRQIDFTDSIDTALNKWRVKCINTLVVNFFNLDEMSKEFFTENYGLNMKEFWNLMHNDRQSLSKLIQTYNDQLVLLFSDDKLIKKLNSFYNRYGSGGFDQISDANCHLFKSKLAEAVYQKFMDIDKEIEEIELNLNGKREFETARQLHYDDDEDFVASTYKRFKRLNDDASVSDRKLARVDTDLTKQKHKLIALNNKLEYLMDISDDELTDDELNDDEETSQTRTLESLQQKVEKLKQEFNRINEECDATREKYQSSSSVALQLSQKLIRLKQQNEKIDRKISGPGMAQLPELIEKDALLSYELKLKHLEKKNEFMQQFFLSKIESLYQERQQLLENSGSGANNRQNNRASRAATPL